MNYAEIINLVFSIIFLVFGVTYCHFIIFAILGIFGRKKFPKAKEHHKFGIIIPCRNEEVGIGNLIRSIQKTNYPQDKLNIYVMAHNCTDNTAERARELGVKVYEYNNDAERTKGYALKYLFEQLKIDLPNGIEDNEGYFIFDADNLVTKDYFDKMNDAFEASGCKGVVTSFRNSKNFGSSIMSGLYGIYFLYGCRYEMRGRTITGCSTRVSGTGYVISSNIMKNGWNYVTLTEDWELTADQIIENQKVIYCDEAEFYDEQPTKFKVMWRQRERWSRGHLEVCVTRMKALLKSLFSSGKKNKYKMSLYDLMANIMPFCLILTTLGILQFVLLLFSPLFGLSFGTVMLDWLKNTAISGLMTYGVMSLSAVLLFIVERKRIKGVSFFKKVMLVLLWPFFIMIQFLIDVVALFDKNCSWKPIPHEDSTSIESLNKKDTVLEDDTNEI